MNMQDLTRCYYIQQEDILKLKKLRLLDHVPVIDGQMHFNDENVGWITEMIHLMKLGLDDHSLVNYNASEDTQTYILKKLRASILEQLHLYQKKLDDVDYMIYEKENRKQKEGML